MNHDRECTAPASGGAPPTADAAARLHLILDAVDDGIYGLDERGMTTFVNRAARSILGWDLGGLIGGRQHDVIHYAHADGTPHDADECPIYRVLQTGGTVEVADDTFWTREGDPIPVSYTATAIEKDGAVAGAVVVFRDRSRTQRAHQRTRAALRALAGERQARTAAEADREWLYGLFESVPALVAITAGPAHVFQFANRRLRSTVGDRVLIGRPFAEALPSIASQGAKAILDRVFETGEPYFGVDDVVRMDTHEGEVERILNRTVQPIRLPDGEAGLLLHHTDVTATAQARRELEATLEELRAVTEELERSNDELDQFAYAASHDLKAPLRGINHLATWLGEDHAAGLDETGREYLDLIRSRIGRLEALIDGLLEYSRIGRGAKVDRLVDMNKVVADALDLVPRPPHVRAAIEGSLPAVFADPVRIRQLVQNLVSNAVKYASSRVSIAARPASGPESLHVFEVRDDGPGIAPEYQDRIWGVFQRLESSEDSDGTGIGLALVRKIAREAGGDAWVTSVPGEGATFTFTWPMADTGEEAA